MKNQALVVWRIYSANFVSRLGSWLTFLGIALLVGEKYGTQQVAYTFLIQSIPPLILSRGLNRMIPPRLNYSVFQLSQLLLALNVGLLAVDPTLVHIYVYLLVASTISCIASPLSNTLIGEWVESKQLSSVYTRVGAIQSGTLAFAPMLGGWLAIRAGFHWLFVADAISFVMAALILTPKPPTLNPVSNLISKFRLRETLTHFVSKPDLAPVTSIYLSIWFLFLSVGAYLNAIEFAFFHIDHLSKEQIGVVIAMWGVGNFLAFLFSSRPTWLGSLRLNAMGYVLALLAFVFAQKLAGAGVSFLVAGFTYTKLGGTIRSLLQQSARNHPQPLTVWAYANQIGSLINILFYGGVGWLLTRMPTIAISLGIVGLGLIFFVWVVRTNAIQSNAQPARDQ